MALVPANSHRYDGVQVSGSASIITGNLILNSFPDHTHETAHTISAWLSPPDVSINHHVAVKKRTADSGSWIFQRREFVEFLHSAPVSLWLSGIPGSGKTILCSAIIDETIRYCSSQPSAGYAYFYFDFGDQSKAQLDGLIRSLITQLVSQANIWPPSLHTLYRLQCGNGERQPPMTALVAVLRDLVARLDDCFIIIDAIDECENRESLLELLLELLNGTLGSLHILVTSRRERDIEDVLFTNHTLRVETTSRSVDDDIRLYIQDRLSHSRKWKKWPELVRAEVLETVQAESDGMFRWAALQLDQLERCRTLASLRKALRTSPPDLSSVYDRIILSIDERDRGDVLKVLRWTCFSNRPVTVGELVEVIAVDSVTWEFHPDYRLVDPMNLFDLCSGLIVRTDDEIENDIVVRFAHSSVTEYLRSSRFDHLLVDIQVQMDMTWAGGHAFLAETCLTYLQHVFQDVQRLDTLFSEFPLAQYAAEYWFDHFRSIEREGRVPDDLTARALALFENKLYLSHCWEFFDPDYHSLGLLTGQLRPQSITPLYCAAQAGLETVVEGLLQGGASISEPAGRYGTALHAAALAGRIGVVEILLEEIANSSVPDLISQLTSEQGRIGLPQKDETQSPMQEQLYDVENIIKQHTASSEYLEEKVKLAVESDIESGKYGSPLQLAAYAGHEKIVGLLLRYRMNAETGALHAASYQGHISVFELLRKHGHDDGKMDIQGCTDQRKRTVLHKAAMNGQCEMLRLLLTCGLNIDAVDDQQSTALHLAVERHHFDAFNLLLDNKAAINTTNNLFQPLSQAFENFMKIDVNDYEVDPEHKEKREGQATVIVLRKKAKKLNAQAGHSLLVRKHFSFAGLPDQIAERATECLWREQYILRHLSHENIVKFMGFHMNEEKEEAMIYMEYWGSDLRQFVKQEPHGGRKSPFARKAKEVKALSQLEIWVILADLSSALAYCHHGVLRDGDSYTVKAGWKSVLHRDIKPGNILRHKDRNGIQVAKLCDLGLAKVENKIISQHSRGLGTESHMAPEVLDGGPPTMKGDIFSLAATIKDLNCDFQDPVLRSLLARCTETRPDRRPSSLDILQIARRNVADIQRRSATELSFIRGHEASLDYLLQVFVEILNRILRCFKFLKPEKRKEWSESLVQLKQDTEAQNWEKWRLDSSLLLVLIVQEYERACQMIEDDDKCEPALSVVNWDDCGLRPLHIAACEARADVVDLLLAKEDVDVDAPDDDDDTALHLAAAVGHLDIVQRLLQGGASVDVRNKKNKTAAERAKENHHDVVATTLLGE